MFGFFKKKNKEKQSSVLLVDINGTPLQTGDYVDCFRYGLGKSKLIKEGMLYYYKSEENGQKMSYLKMVDAVTGYQKVRKINN